MLDGKFWCGGCEQWKSPEDFYRLRRNKNGRMPRCKECHDRARANIQVRLKMELVAAYGGCCRCCGEDAIEFLSIDHVGGGGLAHRRSLGITGGTNFYAWLRRQGYPQEGFRLLCYNCNQATGPGQGRTCPHDAWAAEVDFNVVWDDPVLRAAYVDLGPTDDWELREAWAA